MVDEQIETNLLGDFEQWAFLEIMGFRKISGRIKTETIFGATLLRVDSPFFDEAGGLTWATQYFGSSAIFSIRISTQEHVLKNAPRRFARIAPPPQEGLHGDQPFGGVDDKDQYFDDENEPVADDDDHL